MYAAYPADSLAQPLDAQQLGHEIKKLQDAYAKSERQRLAFERQKTGLLKERDDLRSQLAAAGVEVAHPTTRDWLWDHQVDIDTSDPAVRLAYDVFMAKPTLPCFYLYVGTNKDCFQPDCPYAHNLGRRLRDAEQVALRFIGSPDELQAAVVRAAAAAAASSDTGASAL